MKLGAEKWVDFRETTDLVKDIVDATDGLGAHAAVVTAAPAAESAVCPDGTRVTNEACCAFIPVCKPRPEIC